MPLLASPQGGAGCVIKKISRSILSDADGVVYHRSFGEPPRPSRPPLLAVMQGGAFAFPSTLYGKPRTHYLLACLSETIRSAS